MKKKWDEARLEEVLGEMEARVRGELKSKSAEAVAIAECLGYWLFELKGCQIGGGK